MVFLGNKLRSSVVFQVVPKDSISSMRFLPTVVV